MKNKKIINILLIAALLIGIINPTNTPTDAASKVKLNKTSVTLCIGKTTTLKVKGTKKKVAWTSGDKKIATVTKKGKVTAKSVGTTKITAKVQKKKYSCTVKVTASDTKPTPTQEPSEPTAAPTSEPTEPTAVPTQEPTQPTESAISDNFDKLKAYILKDGNIGEDGDYSISMSDSETAYSIYYREINGLPAFQFASIFIDDTATFMDASSMVLQPSNVHSATFTSSFYLLGADDNGYEAEATIDPKSFTKDKTLVFQVTNQTVELGNETIQAFENSRVAWGFYSWEMLLNKAGLKWSDLGFTAY